MSSLRSTSPPVLQSLLSAAYRVDPRDCLIAPIGEHVYSTLFSLIPVALAVLRVVAEIEPTPSELIEWYRHDFIRELGDLTAERLVALGRVQALIDFLYAVRDGRRN